MMDTVLNVGVTDATVTYLTELNQGYTKFALDLQRRFIYMFGTLVLRLPTAKYERVMAHAVQRDGVTNPSALSVDSLLYLVREFKQFTAVPEDPYIQLRMVIEAMYQHSFSPG
jgi:pyruvate, orthophosphate dikinase